MLTEKNIPFEVTEIDLKDKPDWFLRISPYGKVPVLKHGDTVLYESAVINEYLEETFPAVALLPGDPAQRAHQRIWIDFCNTRLQPAVVGVMRAAPEAFGDKVAELEGALGMLEAHLGEHGLPAPYFLGERFGMVDATVAPAFERMDVLPALRGYEVPGRFERVLRWKAALAAHPSVAATATAPEALVANYRHFVPEAARRAG